MSGRGVEEWAVVIDTNDPVVDELSRVYRAKEEVAVEARSLVVLQRV